MNLRDYHDCRNGLLLRIADVRRELFALEASLEALEDTQSGQCGNGWTCNHVEADLCCGGGADRPCVCQCHAEVAA